MLPLSSVRTQKECEAFLHKFSDRNNECEKLVVVVDVTQVSHAVLNNVRQLVDAIDADISREHRRAVIKRLHDGAAAVSTALGDGIGRSPTKPSGAVLHPVVPVNPGGSGSSQDDDDGVEESKGGEGYLDHTDGIPPATPSGRRSVGPTDAAVPTALQSLLAAAAAVPSRPKHFVVLVHSPASWLHVKAAYPCLPLLEWKYVYADAHSVTSCVISAKEWMAVACGLQRSLVRLRVVVH